MKKQNTPKYVIYFLLAFFLLTLWGYRNGNIGMSENAMLRENAEYRKDGYSVSSGVGETMAVFLQYTPDRKDMDVDVYVKRKGAVGWFFRYSNSTSAATGQIDRVYCLELEGNQEYALICAGLEAIDRIEVELSENSRRIIRPEEGVPGAYILDRSWSVTIYDTNGNVIKPAREKM